MVVNFFQANPRTLKISNYHAKAINYTLSQTANRQQIQNKVNQISQQLAQQPGQQNAKIYVSLHFEKLGFWRSGQGVSAGQHPDLYSPNRYYEEVPNAHLYNKVDRFQIIVTRPKVGNSEKNDCLYNCLYLAFGCCARNLAEKIRTADKLKFYLGLGRKDKVDVKDFPIIEKVQGCSISVEGDFVYESQLKDKYNYHISCVATDGHLELKNNVGRMDDVKIIRHHKPKTANDVISWRYFNGKVELWDGEQLSSISANKFAPLRRKFDKLYIRCNDGDLENTRNTYIRKAEQMLKMSEGKINLFKYDSMYMASMDFFIAHSKCLLTPEPIGIEETEFLRNAFMGGIMWADTGYEGELHGYDINAKYPSVLCDQYFNFPVKAGEIKIIDEKEFTKYDTFSCGIYRAIIKKSNSKKDALFRFNFLNYYTHLDLNAAKKLGFNIKLIIDDKPNCCRYTNDKLANGRKVFHKYVNYLYDLKTEGCEAAKDMLTCLWGSLSKKNTKKLEIRGDDELQMPKGYNTIVSFTPIDDEANNITVKMEKTKCLFKSKFARLSCFITSFARFSLMKDILPFIDNIKRIQTDSFCTDIDIREKLIESGKLGSAIGLFKCESKTTGKFKIKNTNEITRIID